MRCRIHRGFDPLKQKVKRMHDLSLKDESVRLLIYEAFMDQKIKGIQRQIMPLVHNHYFHPNHEAFYPRNLWSLSNAFTSAFKKLSPVKQFEITARLGTFLTQVQDDLKPKAHAAALPAMIEGNVTANDARPVLALVASNTATATEVGNNDSILTEKNAVDGMIVDDDEFPENYPWEDADNYYDEEEQLLASTNLRRKWMQSL